MWSGAGFRTCLLKGRPENCSLYMESNVAQLHVADKLWTWFEANKKPVIGGTAVALIAGIIIWFVVWQRDQTQVAASEALSNVEAGQLGGAAQPASAQDYLKVASTYPNTKAGARAVLLAAGSLFDQGKYAEAQAQFEKFTREHRDSPFLGEAQMGVAACLDAQGKTDQAITAYKDIIQRHTGEAYVPQAQFALGRIYEAQNKPEQARDQYEQVERADPFLGPEAGMRLEELKAKFPALAPAAPGLTNAPIRIEKK